MHITFTDEAIKKINEKIDGKEGYLKLKYDIDGCGCVMSGIPTLWYILQPEGIDELTIETNLMPILIEKSKTVFLDKQLKVDFSKTANSFQLKSPAQILNGRMNFILYPKVSES
ncbi:iron-sulfur cluster biosynthesis family protein [Bacillus seohaeanensis]|jgi:uncharacterized protein YqkB|uniref:Iron-sulfur cluster biosynthesis family protein n=1 Tax=Bacillus seohaeanensis TaxID=284580 RepID=A0ABW5RLQ2_9BACI